MACQQDPQSPYQSETPENSGRPISAMVGTSCAPCLVQRFTTAQNRTADHFFWQTKLFKLDCQQDNLTPHVRGVAMWANDVVHGGLLCGVSVWEHGTQLMRWVVGCVRALLKLYGWSGSRLEPGGWGFYRLHARRLAGRPRQSGCLFICPPHSRWPPPGLTRSQSWSATPS
jgi:hypothetical protein